MNLEIGQEIWYIEYGNKITQGKVIALKEAESSFSKNQCCIETEKDFKAFEVVPDRVFTTKWAAITECASKLQKEASAKLIEAADLFKEAEKEATVQCVPKNN